MTYEEREAIFSKEALTNEDLRKLFDISASEASKLAQQIKRKVGDRLGIAGRLHVQDYLLFAQGDTEGNERYKTKAYTDKAQNVQREEIKKRCSSVCI